MLDNFLYKKSFGQNFLNDYNVIDKIISVANIDKDTLVVEIGPGSGVLSNRIIPLSSYSILYEIDDRLDNILENRLNKYDNYKVIFGDFLQENVCDEIKKYAYKKLYVVANLPYYITSPIVFKITEELEVDKLVIMVQKEVADRFCASVNTKNYGYVSAYLNYYYNVRKEFFVSRNCFVPVPKVDSMVISLESKRERNCLDEEFLNKLMKDSFKYKRKNLRNNLKGYDLVRIEDVLKRNNLSLTSRAEDVSSDIFVLIANELIKQFFFYNFIHIFLLVI